MGQVGYRARLVVYQDRLVVYQARLVTYWDRLVAYRAGWILGQVGCISGQVSYISGQVNCISCWLHIRPVAYQARLHTAYQVSQVLYQARLYIRVVHIVCVLNSGQLDLHVYHIPIKRETDH